MSAGEHRSEGPAAARPRCPDSPDEAVERLVSRGPDMSMEPELEERERAVTLAKAVETAAAKGLSAGGEAGLREILDRLCNTFWPALHGDPPARVEPLTVTLKPEAKVVKTQGRVYSPTKTAWLTTCIGTLVTLGLLFYNLHTVWASAAMAVPKKGG